MRPISPTDAAYASGFFDGEGTIDIRYRVQGQYERFFLACFVPQMKIEPLLFFKERWIGNMVRPTPANPCHKFVMVSKNAEKFLRDIRPFLIGKAAEADIAIAFSAPI